MFKSVAFFVSAILNRIPLLLCLDSSYSPVFMFSVLLPGGGFLFLAPFPGTLNIPVQLGPQNFLILGGQPYLNLPLQLDHPLPFPSLPITPRHYCHSPPSALPVTVVPSGRLLPPATGPQFQWSLPLFSMDTAPSLLSIRTTLMRHPLPAFLSPPPSNQLF